ncbi:MAG TPA: DoxX family protein [Actinomycetes bacterium]|nr:DoxX family protein [Actinomycetes bacterium]
MEWVATFLALALAVVMIMFGLAKVQRLPASLQIRDRLQVSAPIWTVWGALDLVAAGALTVGVFAIPGLAIAAALVFAITMVALLVLQLRAGDPPSFAVPVVLLIVAAALTAFLVASVTN